MCCCRPSNIFYWMSLGLLLLASCRGTGAAGPAAGDLAREPLVDVVALAPRIRVDLTYGRADNFTGEVLYERPRALLRAGAARRLARVQARLERRGLGLVVWDAYRPLAVQRLMWALVPDPRYVADPARGSRHNRGAAVDVSLVDFRGRPLALPTGHDDFSERAARDSALPDPEARRLREVLRAAMEAEGFTGISTEWWHYDAPHWEAYPVVGAAGVAGS